MSESSDRHPLHSTDDDPLDRGSGSGVDGSDGGRSPAAANSEADVDPLPLDVVFDILKNSRRRLVLQHLVDGSGTTTLSELSQQIAAEENEKPVNALTSAERKRVYVGLYQGHLPRLDEANVVEFDDDRGTVTVGDNLEQVTRHLDGAIDVESGHWAYYLSVSAIGGAAFGAQNLVFSSGILSTAIVGTTLVVIAGLAFFGA
jgi:hypothetical protein